MQIPAVSSTAQTLLNNTQNVDGSRQAPGAVGGTSQPEDASQATGQTDSSGAVQSQAQSLQEVTDAPEPQAPTQTQVVTAADETLGTTLGLNIDTTA